MMLIGKSATRWRAGTTRDGIRRALAGAAVPLVAINPRALGVEEDDLAAFMAKGGKCPGRGRPRGAKNRKIPEG